MLILNFYVLQVFAKNLFFYANEMQSSLQKILQFIYILVILFLDLICIYSFETFFMKISDYTFHHIFLSMILEDQLIVLDDLFVLHFDFTTQ